MAEKEIACGHPIRIGAEKGLSLSHKTQSQTPTFTPKPCERWNHRPCWASKKALVTMLVRKLLAQSRPAMGLGSRLNSRAHAYVVVAKPKTLMNAEGGWPYEWKRSLVRRHHGRRQRSSHRLAEFSVSISPSHKRPSDLLYRRYTAREFGDCRGTGDRPSKGQPVG